jgi:hypothetical protein
MGFKRRGPGCHCQYISVHASTVPFDISARISEVNASQVRSLPKEGHSLDTSWNPVRTIIGKSKAIFNNFDHSQNMDKNGQHIVATWIMWNSCNCRIWSQRIWIPNAWHSVRLCKDRDHLSIRYMSANMLQYAGQNAAKGATSHVRTVWTCLNKHDKHVINMSSIVMTCLTSVRWSLAQMATRSRSAFEPWEVH